jgi:HEAT repeat protein
MTKKTIGPHFLLQVAVLCLATSSRGAEPDLTTILQGLRSARLNYIDLHALLYLPPSPVIRNALHDAFDHFASKRERQEIAAVLAEIGDDDPRYFRYLEGFAKAAVEDSTPFFMAFDDTGRVSREARNFEFERWCRDRNANPGEIARLQYDEYPRDVDLLQRTRDPRGIAVLLEGLRSPNPFVVAKAGQGLALQGRTDAVPILAKACETFTKDGCAIVARAFAEFQTPVAEEYLAQFEVDWRLRLEYEKAAAQRRADHAKRLASRAGGR